MAQHTVTCLKENPCQGNLILRQKRDSLLSVLASIVLIGLAVYIATAQMARIRGFIQSSGLAGLAIALLDEKRRA